MENKKRYYPCEIEICKYSCEDIVTTSGGAFSSENEKDNLFDLNAFNND